MYIIIQKNFPHKIDGNVFDMGLIPYYILAYIIEVFWIFFDILMKTCMWGSMSEKREFQRFDIKQNVYLYHGISKYEGILDNISCSGALVTISAVPELLQPGDMCHLAFAAHPDAIVCSCLVTRMYLQCVGLQFADTAASA